MVIKYFVFACFCHVDGMVLYYVSFLLNLCINKKILIRSMYRLNQD